MNKEELRNRLKELPLGEPARFRMAGTDEPLWVERSLTGLAPCWIIDFRGERHVMNDADEAAAWIAPHLRPDLRDSLSRDSDDLGEIVDLGEY